MFKSNRSLISGQQIQVAQLWQTDHMTHDPTTLRGWVTLRLNLRLNCYVSQQYL